MCREKKTYFNEMSAGLKTRNVNSLVGVKMLGTSTDIMKINCLLESVCLLKLTDKKLKIQQSIFILFSYLNTII